jgi:hypothetical protein
MMRVCLGFELPADKLHHIDSLVEDLRVRGTAVDVKLAIANHSEGEATELLLQLIRVIQQRHPEFFETDGRLHKKQLARWISDRLARVYDRVDEVHAD